MDHCCLRSKTFLHRSYSASQWPNDVADR